MKRGIRNEDRGSGMNEERGSEMNKDRESGMKMRRKLLPLDFQLASTVILQQTFL